MPQHVDPDRLATAFRARRARLRLAQDVIARKAGVSLSTVSLIENGRRSGYQPLTKAAIEDVIGWAPGSIDALLAGGDPTVIEEPAPEADDGPGVDAVGSADGQVFVLQAKRLRPELADLLDRMPAAARVLWERLAWRIADELATSGHIPAETSTISDEVLTEQTASGPAQYVTSSGQPAASAQVEAAAEQLRLALDLLTEQTRRSVR